jgi:hypothetical protein
MLLLDRSGDYAPDFLRISLNEQYGSKVQHHIFKENRFSCFKNRFNFFKRFSLFCIFFIMLFHNPARLSNKFNEKVHFSFLKKRTHLLNKSSYIFSPIVVNDYKMLNFFVTMVNTIGIPVVLVGTNKAVSILQSEFRQARRGSGQGDMIWGQVPKDETWELFLEGLWEYQWTKTYVPLTPEMSDLIYDQSQGVLDIAVKLFMLSQVSAISNQEEKISERIIKQASKESLRLVQPMLEALRSGIPSEINKYEDIRSIDFDKEIEKYKASIDINKKIRIQKKLQEQKRKKTEQNLLEEVTLQLLSMDFDPKAVQSAIKKVFKRLGEDIEKAMVIKETVKILIEKDQKKEQFKTKKKSSSEINYLGQLMKEARSHKKSVYEWFCDKDIIKSPLDESWKEDEHAALVSHSVS